MINSFQVGAVVTGNSFIGRKELVKQYKKQFLTKAKSSSVSIIGITRIGKTSFVRNVFDKIPESIIYSYSNLKESSTYQELWQTILMPIQEYLEKSNLITKELIDLFSRIEDEDLPWIKLRSTIKRIFLYLSERQLKSILVLDEFDYASELFNSETKKFELFRSVISNPDYNLVAILISRRNLHDIEGQTFQSSTFRGVFDTRYFKGFDIDDLQDYYKVFENKKIKLTKEQREEIQYYAGNSPYLLSIVGNRILDRKKNAKKIDIPDIFNNDCRQINDYYADVLKHMERDNTKNKLISFVLGPNIGITKSDVEELVNLGYIQRTENNDYIPISKYFGDYLRNHKLNESLWEKMTATEKKIKIVIAAETEILKEKYGIIATEKNVIEKEIISNINSITPRDIDRYSAFIYSTKRDWNKETTYFDVMSLSDSFKIITLNWNIFSKYFKNDLIEDWEYKFRLIGKARNPAAHSHEEYISDSIKIDVDNYCSDIQRTIAKVYSGGTESNTIKVVKTDNEIDKKYDDIPNNNTKNIYFFTGNKIGKNGNLKGILESNPNLKGILKGSISNQQLRNNNKMAEDLLDKKTKVVLVSLNTQGNGWILDLI